MDSAWSLSKFYENNYSSSAGGVATVEYSADYTSTLSCQMHTVWVHSRVQANSHQ